MTNDLSKIHGLRSRLLHQDNVDASAVYNGYPGALPMLPVQDFSVFILPDLTEDYTPEAAMGMKVLYYNSTLIIKYDSNCRKTVRDGQPDNGSDFKVDQGEEINAAHPF